MTDSFDEYYEWWHTAETVGLPGRVSARYYKTHDPESVFQVQILDETYDYPILLSDRWVWPRVNSLEFEFDDTVTQTTFSEDALVSAISRMSWVSDGNTVNSLEEAEEYVWNGDVYTPTDVSGDTISVGQSDFYSVLCSREPLIRELNTALFDADIPSDADIADDILLAPIQLSYRDEFAETLWDIMALTRNEPLPIGGTYPIVLKTEDSYEMLFSRRSTEVASWPEYVTITPAGYFAPDGIDNRLGVLNQFYSEYCEELFNQEEGTVDGQTGRVRQAEQMFADGDAEFSVTGFGVEAVGLSFEVSGVFIVHNEAKAAEMKDSFDLNYEVDAVECVSLEEVDRFAELLHPEQVTPPSALAIVNAVRYLSEEVGVSTAVGDQLDIV